MLSARPPGGNGTTYLIERVGHARLALVAVGDVLAKASVTTDSRANVGAILIKKDKTPALTSIFKQKFLELLVDIRLLLLIIMLRFFEGVQRLCVLIGV